MLPLPGAKGQRCGVCGSRDLRSVDEESPLAEGLAALRDLPLPPEPSPKQPT